VLDTTTATPCTLGDTGFSATSVSVKVSGKETTATCIGTTTKKPAKLTKCDGELLGGGETTPTQPCTILLGSAALHIDDWAETVSSSGKVTLKCTASPTDTK
jgi:hypothetical protein